MCPNSSLGEQENTTEPSNLSLSPSESYAATHQAVDAHAGAGQWYPRLKNGILEIVMKAV